eukprot:scaffold233680_cov32-Prasinocladus_malaysianus.AAC.1
MMKCMTSGLQRPAIGMGWFKRSKQYLGVCKGMGDQGCEGSDESLGAATDSSPRASFAGRTTCHHRRQQSCRHCNRQPAE